ncbi:MAG: DEAD/DEAH box helicase [Gammaproteobacteria bacterium]
MSFENLNLHPGILRAISASGYSAPTPIQAQAIPEVLAGHDLLASAQTGTGKTAAFMLPALQRLTVASTVHGRGPRVLVLTPTRELAQQVNDAANKYGKFLRLRTANILGGMPYPPQIKQLAAPMDIMVATPGRLIDHMGRGRVDFSRLELLILDEADRMLDMGFIDDVKAIASATPATRQTLLFSATVDNRIAALSKQLLKDPKRIEISHSRARHENIEQRLHYVDDADHKNRLLEHFLSDGSINKAIVFTATKRDADALAEELQIKGHRAAALHGDMHQRARSRTIEKLHRGAVRILVATDVAARGIDVNGISHVFNFDLPRQAEDYVHRIGRTGRAGASGIAISFASYRDFQHLKRIEHYTGQPIAAHVIPGLEPKRQPRREARPGKSGSSGAPAARFSRRNPRRPGADGPARRDNGAAGRPRANRRGDDRRAAGAWRER